MRFAAYAGTSVVLAAGTILRAFLQRPNFYSASIQISQSNACLMILTNVALLGVSMAMFGLQRLFYGPLRPVEIEQLYEKAWFAITETCLAMTIFREEVGGWFLIMFVSLLIGKIWGWIGEGRVEILEQQPPVNPRLFHAQLSMSLSISALFDFLMLHYSISTVLSHARPDMMVMFAFEFAVLTVTSLSTAARYGISVYEAGVIKKQIRQRRNQIRQERLQERSSRNATENNQGVSEVAADIDSEVESMDIDAPGWEEKGRWIFYLDLTTDFLKLVLYITFFCVLCMFYGMPIHIIRDVALTVRSFYKRITDFVRYRQATRDMNARYADATPDELSREDVCIICREDIRPWTPQVRDNEQAPDDGHLRAPSRPLDERLRPKKLPCGHILHFACLRSWLERQQNCPTCRRPVLSAEPLIRPHATNLHQQQRRPNAAANPVPQQNPAANPVVQQNVYHFGPLRIAFGMRNVPNPARQNNPPPVSDQPAPAPTSSSSTRNRALPHRQTLQSRSAGSQAISIQLQQIEQQISREVHELRLQADQLHLVRALQSELTRLRSLQSQPYLVNPATVPSITRNLFPSNQIQATFPAYNTLHAPFVSQQALQQLPYGHTLPEGWTVLPLRQISSHSGPAQRSESSIRHPRTDRVPGEPAPASSSSDVPRASPFDPPNHSEGSDATPRAHDIGQESNTREFPGQTNPDIQQPSNPSSGLAPPADKGTHSEQSPSVEDSPEAHSHQGSSNSIGLPHWGSSNESGTVDVVKKGDVGENVTSNGLGAAAQEGSTPSDSPPMRVNEKGKGRATTVEDDPEGPE